MAQLQFLVKHQHIRRTDIFPVVADSQNYLYARFLFGSNEWDGVEKTAIFRKGGTAYEMLLDSNNECEVPHEVLAGAGDVAVSIFGGSLITVDTAIVKVAPSGYSDDLESSTDPTPSIYEQIVERLNKVENLEVEAESLAAGSGATIEKSIDPETGGYVFEFGIPQGNAGFSPVITVTDTNENYIVTMQDSTHTETITIKKEGAQGPDGESAYEIAVDNGYVGTEEQWLASLKGADGEDGEDGHSPVITTSKSGTTTTILSDGSSIGTVEDGADGKDGKDGNDGKDGADGHSPVVTASKNGGVTTVYVDGSSIATINDGTDGEDGTDGHSPVVTASKSNGVTTISVDGTGIATINDGEDGSSGVYYGTSTPPAGSNVWIDPSGTSDAVVQSATVTTIWTGTQVQYDAITTKDANTLYFIKET